MAEENVLVVSADRFQHFAQGKTGLIPTNVDGVNHLLAGELTFRPRSEVEEDESWRQIIPYCILRYNRYVFRYTRGKASGEQRLRLKKSIGIGGHINNRDGNLGLFAIENAINRELHEEVPYRATIQEKDLFGLLYDDSDAVGRVHVGIAINVRLGDPMAVANERESLMDSGFSHIKAIAAERELYENWSKLCIDYLCKE